MAKKLSHELIQPRAKEFVMGHQHQRNLKYKQRKGEEKLEGNMNQEIEPKDLTDDAIAENAKRFREKWNAWLNSCRKAFEKDQGPNGLTQIDLMNGMFIYHKGDETGRPQNDEYIVCVFKTTRSTAISVNKPNANLSMVNGIHFKDNIILSGFDPYYCAWCSISFAKQGPLMGQPVDCGGQPANYRESGNVSISTSADDPTLMYANVLPIINIPEFEGNFDFKSEVRSIVGLVKESFPLMKEHKSFENCDKKGNNLFFYMNGTNKRTPSDKQLCGTFGGSTYKSPSQYLYWGKGTGKDGWKPPIVEKKVNFSNWQTGAIPSWNGTWDTSKPMKIYTNAYGFINDILVKYLGYRREDITYVTHPKDIPSSDGGGYMCDGNPWTDDTDVEKNDSTLAPEIDKIIQQEGKRFYLIGKQKVSEGNGQHKLYVFNNDMLDLRYDGGQLPSQNPSVKLEKLSLVPCYRQEGCKWIKEKNQDFIFSVAIDDIDTSFGLLKVSLHKEHMSQIGTITINKANEFLVRKFGQCTIPKPDGGGGDSGGGGEGGGPDGQPFPPAPDVPYPDMPLPPAGCDYPNVPAPPEDKPNTGGQTPVSQIRLLKVPELSPSYSDTYMFDNKGQQQTFFIGRASKTFDRYTYLRKDNALMLGCHIDEIHSCNYVMYKNASEKVYYCFIMNKEYINEKTTRVTIATDVIQTYLFDFRLRPSYVDRCHVDRWKDGLPTKEYEPEGLEHGDPLQVESITTGFRKFNGSYVAVCSNPLGFMPSRQKPKEEGNDAGQSVSESL